MYFFIIIIIIIIFGRKRKFINLRIQQRNSTMSYGIQAI